MLRDVVHTVTSRSVTTGSVGRVEDMANPGDSTRGAEVASDPVVDGPTGDLAVDESLELLDGLAQRPLSEHVAAFEAVHGALQDRLAAGQR